MCTKGWMSIRKFNITAPWLYNFGTTWIIPEGSLLHMMHFEKFQDIKAWTNWFANNINNIFLYSNVWILKETPLKSVRGGLHGNESNLNSKVSIGLCVQSMDLYLTLLESCRPSSGVAIGAIRPRRVDYRIMFYIDNTVQLHTSFLFLVSLWQSNMKNIVHNVAIPIF